MKKEKLNTILIYVLGSVIFLAIPILVSPDLKRSDLWRIPPFRRDFLAYVLLLLFFFLNYFIFTPKLYFNKKYLLFILILIGSYLIIELLPALLIKNDFFRGPEPPPFMKHRPPPRGIIHEMSRHFFLFLAIVIFSIMMRIRDKWKQSQREKLNAELAYLKAQINPHFLFNTLNSIYSLAIEKSDETATAVVKLSGMMRYVLSEADNEFVSLEKEISYLNDYIELQKLRLGNTVSLSYSVNGNTAGKKIAPLILVPFIENAFKYGVNPEEASDIVIRIDISDEISLFVKNKKVNTNIGQHNKSGLGIKNTRERLQLTYPSHQLEIRNEETEFIVSLKLQL